MAINIILQLGYVESTRFHVFQMSYFGELIGKREELRKRMPELIAKLATDASEFAIRMVDAYRDHEVLRQVWRDRANQPSDVFEWLTNQNYDSAGIDAYDFFERRGWHFFHDGKSPAYTVRNVAAFMDETLSGDSAYLEWSGTTDKVYNNHD